MIFLLFADVSSNRKMLRALLARNGVKMVDLAENGLEAVRAALTDPMKFDVIFMDNLMPVMVLLASYYLEGHVIITKYGIFFSWLLL